MAAAPLGDSTKDICSICAPSPSRGVVRLASHENLFGGKGFRDIGGSVGDNDLGDGERDIDVAYPVDDGVGELPLEVDALGSGDIALPWPKSSRILSSAAPEGDCWSCLEREQDRGRVKDAVP